MPLGRMVKHDGDHLCLMLIVPSSSCKSNWRGSSPTALMASTIRLLFHFCICEETPMRVFWFDYPGLSPAIQR